MKKSKGKILVIDDEDVIRMGCGEILNLQGYKVDLAENSVVGLEKIEKNEYDIVLTDIMMPEMDGMELLDEINRLDKDLVVIVITGYATIESAINAGRKGAFDYLPKPFKTDELLAKIERGLDHRDHLVEVKKLRQERDMTLSERSNERARTMTIINSMSEGVLAINRQKQIVLINPMASKIMHLSEGRVIGRTFDEILRNPDLKKSINDSFEQAQSQLQSTRLQFDTVYGRAIEASITPIMDENNVCIGTAAVLIDITEEKKIEKMKSDFVSYVAHELKAPLGAIEGFLDLILDGVVSGNAKKEREMIQKAHNQTHGLVALINDILDLSRIDRKKSLKEMRPVNIGDLLKESIDFYHNRIDSKSQKLAINLKSDMPAILGNREDLSRLFANLLSNAIKYTPNGGKITVSARATPSHLKIDIKDTGIGISKEAQEHIFDEFYRAPNATDKKITGTGLGLSIAKKITKDHRGMIEIESDENKGATFRVTLPVIRKAK